MRIDRLQLVLLRSINFRLICIDTDLLILNLVMWHALPPSFFIKYYSFYFSKEKQVMNDMNCVAIFKCYEWCTHNNKSCLKTFEKYSLFKVLYFKTDIYEMRGENRESGTDSGWECVWKLAWCSLLLSIPDKDYTKYKSKL